MYVLFEHTADIGIHVESSDLNCLFADAACGLFAVIAGNLDEIQSRETVNFQISGSNKEYLLLDWLSELLVNLSVKRLLMGKFDVTVDEQGLTAVGHGEPLDLSRHQLIHEVKAITYHGLTVAQTAEGWSADVIVDI